MQSLLHSEEELQATLRRAHEIVEASRDGQSSTHELENYLLAAEEVGVPREAFLQALQERIAKPAIEVAIGDQVFAPSADGALYISVVKAISDQGVTVAFESGGEQMVSKETLEPFALVPGRKIEYRDKTWGWSGGKVHKFDPDKRRVKIDNDWAMVDVKLHDIRIPRQKTEREQRVSMMVTRAALSAGAFGTILGWLLHGWLR